MDIQLALMCGTDIPIPELQTVMHQPTMKEISYIGEENFFMAVHVLSLNKNMIFQDKVIPQDISNFQIFMTIMQEKETREKKKSVESLFPLIFPTYKSTFTPQSIIFSNKENNFFIDNNNFDSFQSYIKQIFCLKETQGEEFNPGNEKAKEIAQKLMRGRQRVAAQKQVENKNIFSKYLSVLAIGLHSTSLNELINLTVYQVYDLLERYSLYINWDLDIKSRLAGGNPDSELIDWRKNIH